MNLFASAHKALRFAMQRALVQLGACPGDRAATTAALDATRELLAACALHQFLEDSVVMPAIDARRPGAGARLADAHDAGSAAIAALDGRLAALERGDATPATLHAFYLELSRFVGDNLAHMYEEEVLAWPLLEEIYTPAELATLHDRLVGLMTPAQRAAFAHLMEPALSPLERG